MKAKLEGIWMEGIADSGAGVSVVTREVVERINRVRKGRSEVLPVEIQVDTASKTPLAISGAVLISF